MHRLDRLDPAAGDPAAGDPAAGDPAAWTQQLETQQLGPSSWRQSSVDRGSKMGKSPFSASYILFLLEVEL